MKRFFMLSVVLTILVTPTIFAASPDTAEKSKVIKVTEANYKELTKNNELLVIDFWAPWCGPCRALAPIIEELATEYAGSIAIGKCNVDDNTQLASYFGIVSIPAIYFIKNGKLVDSHIGYCNKATLKAKIEHWK